MSSVSYKRTEAAFIAYWRGGGAEQNGMSNFILSLPPTFHFALPPLSLSLKTIEGVFSKANETRGFSNFVGPLFAGV